MAPACHQERVVALFSVRCPGHLMNGGGWQIFRGKPVKAPQAIKQAESGNRAPSGAVPLTGKTSTKPELEWSGLYRITRTHTSFLPGMFHKIEEERIKRGTVVCLPSS